MFVVQSIQVHTSILKGLPIPASPSFSIIHVAGLFFPPTLRCSSLILPFFLRQVPVSGTDFMTFFSGVELADLLLPSAVLLRRITLPTLWSPLPIPISSWPDDFFLLNETKLVLVSEESLLGVLGMDR